MVSETSVFNKSNKINTLSALCLCQVNTHRGESIQVYNYW